VISQVAPKVCGCNLTKIGVQNRLLKIIVEIVNYFLKSIKFKSFIVLHLQGSYNYTGYEITI